MGGGGQNKEKEFIRMMERDHEIICCLMIDNTDKR